MPPLSRRTLLRSAGLLAGGALLPAAPVAAQSGAGGDRRTVLVLLELAGGNDALNTLVPYRDPLYRRLRPNLAWPNERLLALSDDLALPDALGALAPHWEAGDLALLPSIGTPEHDRSHFRAADIWEAGDAQAAGETGWLAPLLAGRADLDVPGIVLGGRSGPLAGCGAVHIADPARFLAESRQLAQALRSFDSAALRHVVGVHNANAAVVQRLAARLAAGGRMSGRRPGSGFARQLFNAEQILGAGVRTAALKLVLPGFDTHANQPGRHERLLRELARGLDRFAARLKARGLWRDTVLVCWSEFGRRVRENASRGTDHGGAGTVLLLGGRVRGGIHGAFRSLETLDDGDLPVATDYRRLYASLAAQVLGVADNAFTAAGHAPLPDLIG